jgi:hypothetical protein
MLWIINKFFKPNPAFFLNAYGGARFEWPWWFGPLLPLREPQFDLASCGIHFGAFLVCLSWVHEVSSLTSSE